MGEGGGQVLRASLALSAALGKPFRMTNIRARRPKPGLKRQHLTCVRAVQTICGAKVEGDAVNSVELEFSPGAVRPGEYQFQVGTGGSVTLVLQAVVPPLLLGETPSEITVTGGTHVPYAPPFEFMRDTLFPQLARLGPQATARMDRVGYMDTGGGSVTVNITPAAVLTPFQRQEAEEFSGAEAVIYGHNLPEGIVERETTVLLAERYEPLGLTAENIRCENSLCSAASPSGSGNAVLVTVRRGESATVFGECGWRGRTAEKVARQACKRALVFMKSEAPVEEHLADQLLVPLALAGGGAFVAKRITPHARTCLDVIARFMEIKIDLAPDPVRGVRVTLERKAPRHGDAR
jgi:RNA 3'-terminal phosphate cyclase (ATP)